jgi:hypothetical protein
VCGGVLMVCAVVSQTEINSSTSVDSYFVAATATAANRTSLLQLAEDKRQRTISAPNKGGKSKQLIRQRAEERDSRVVIGLAGCRTAQESTRARVIVCACVCGCVRVSCRVG